MGIESLIMIIAVSQGVFFAMLLLTGKKYKSRPNRFLAWVVLILSLIILRISELIQFEWFTEIFEFIALEYLLPAFLYFYVLTSLGQKIERKVYWWLLSPFVFFSLLRMLTSLADVLELEVWGTFVEAIEPTEIYLIALFIFTVGFVAIQKVRHSQCDPVFKKWLYVNFTAFIVLMALLLLSELVETLFDLDYWEYAWVGAAIFLMGISFFGVQQVSIGQQITQIKAIQVHKNTNAATERDRSAKSHYDRLKLLMIEKELFKNPALSRELIAEEMGLGASTVSRILKENGGQSLNEFINQYRVARAKELLDDPQFDIFSLEAIGKEVGFKSRSTFYDTFKKMTGLTPGKYKKRTDLS